MKTVIEILNKELKRYKELAKAYRVSVPQNSISDTVVKFYSGKVRELQRAIKILKKAE